ncbi:MAG: hypothetical protein Q9176_005118 [Flavoplaca citrina]
MAWVRPKHPPPKKPKPNPVSTLLPMLSYLSSSRPPPPPISPTKAKPHHISSTPLSRDPILRSFQQTQAISQAEPEPPYEESRPKPSQSKRRTPSLSPHEREHRVLASQRAQTVSQGYRDPSPPPPPPPPLAPPRPRVASYERHPPVQIVRERYVPRPVGYPSYQERMASRAISARWASATAALDIR